MQDKSSPTDVIQRTEQLNRKISQVQKMMGELQEEEKEFFLPNHEPENYFDYKGEGPVAVDFKRLLLHYLHILHNLVPQAVDTYQTASKVYGLEVVINLIRGIVNDLHEIEKAENKYDEVIKLLERIFSLWLQDLISEISKIQEKLKRNPDYNPKYVREDLDEVLRSMSRKTKQHYEESLTLLGNIFGIVEEDK